MSRSSLGLLLAFALCACTAQGDPGEGPVEFGLGGKADGGACDRTAPLCWPTADAGAMRRYLGAQDDMVLGLRDSHVAAVAIVDALTALSHKLTAAEQGELAALRVQLGFLGPDAADDVRGPFAADAHTLVAARLVTAFLTAYAVPIGGRASAPSGPADSAAQAEPEPDTGLPTGMHDSLLALRESGAFGHMYAVTLEHTGVLDMTPTPWAEVFPFSEPREARIDRIIDAYAAASRNAAWIAGAESLIPYVGVPLSFTHEVYMQFRLRARLVFEIAAVYGLDVRQDDNLLVAVGVLAGAWHLPDLRWLMAGIVGFPALTGTIAHLAGAPTVRAIIKRALLLALGRMLDSMGRYGAAITARLAATGVARSVGRQVLGYATAGLAIVGDVLLQSMVMRAMGRHADATLRPWGTGMLVSRSPMLLDATTRSCVAQVLGELMQADGVVHPAERELFTGHLSRPVWNGAAWVPLDTPMGLADQAQAAAAVDVAASQGVACAAGALVGKPAETRLQILSWVYTMAAVDGVLATPELARYYTLVERLRGSLLFGDGDELDDSHLDAARARIESMLVGREGALADLPLAVLFEDLTASPDAALAVSCAFDGCP